MNWIYLETSPIISWSVHNVILPIILPVIVVLVLWKILYKKQEARQVDREDKREARQVVREKENIHKQIEATQETIKIEFHTSNLRNTIELWQKKLQDKELRKYESAESVGNPNKFWEIDTSFIDEIEGDILIREKDVYYHYLDLEKVWLDFKDLIKKYRFAKIELFGQVPTLLSPTAT